MPRRSLVIVNPSATTTTERARDVLVSALTRELGVSIATTDGRGHATELARKAAADGLDVIVVLGGDGTVNEVVNGILADSDGRPDAARLPALGIVPGGSTNVLARTLGIPRDPVEATGALLEWLRRGQTHTIGLGRVDERWFTFSAGLGLDAEVVAEVERRREAGARSTTALWIRTAMRQLVSGTDRRIPALTVEAAGAEPTTDVFLVIVSNTAPWTYLGERRVIASPAASFDRGLDVLAVRSLRLHRTVRTVSHMLTRSGTGPVGRHLVRLDDVPEVRVRATRPVALQVDGDFVATVARATFTSVPAALRVLGPVVTTLPTDSPAV